MVSGRLLGHYHHVANAISPFCYVALQGEKPTIQDVRKVIKTCKSLMKHALVMGDDEVHAQAETKKLALDELMDALKRGRSDGADGMSLHELARPAIAVFDSVFNNREIQEHSASFRTH
jgi:hypothetical protein